MEGAGWVSIGLPHGAAARAPRARPARNSRRGLDSSTTGWQPQLEHVRLLFPTDESQLSAVSPGDLARQTEPEAQTIDPAAARRVAAIESVEEPLAIIIDGFAGAPRHGAGPRRQRPSARAESARRRGLYLIAFEPRFCSACSIRA